MIRQVLFIQGGGGEDDYKADAQLVTSLKEALGDGYNVNYPLLPTETTPDFGRIKQIGDEISNLKGDIILVGHSLGASMLLKYLSENEFKGKILGVFLISTPFWEGEEDWKQGLKLQDNFPERLPGDVPIYLYHCRDDEEIPFEHIERYEQKLPLATVRKLSSCGHQLNNNLNVVAGDIMSI